MLPQGELNSGNDGRNVGGQTSGQDVDELSQEVETPLAGLHAAILHQPVDGLHDGGDLIKNRIMYQSLGLRC